MFNKIKEKLKSLFVIFLNMRNNAVKSTVEANNNKVAIELRQDKEIAFNSHLNAINEHLECDDDGRHVIQFSDALFLAKNFGDKIPINVHGEMVIRKGVSEEVRKEHKLIPAVLEKDGLSNDYLFKTDDDVYYVSKSQHEFAKIFLEQQLPKIVKIKNDFIASGFIKECIFFKKETASWRFISDLQKISETLYDDEYIVIKKCTPKVLITEMFSKVDGRPCGISVQHFYDDWLKEKNKKIAEDRVIVEKQQAKKSSFEKQIQDIVESADNSFDESDIIKNDTVTMSNPNINIKKTEILNEDCSIVNDSELQGPSSVVLDSLPRQENEKFEFKNKNYFFQMATSSQYVSKTILQQILQTINSKVKIGNIILDDRNENKVFYIDSLYFSRCLYGIISDCETFMKWAIDENKKVREAACSEIFTIFNSICESAFNDKLFTGMSFKTVKIGYVLNNNLFEISAYRINLQKLINLLENEDNSEDALSEISKNILNELLVLSGEFDRKEFKINRKEFGDSKILKLKKELSVN